MRQFFTGSTSAFNDLAQRARRACVVFDDQEMPPGCTPEKALVGFEINPQTGRTQLLVRKGVLYTGESKPVRDWLANGTLEFANFELLQKWIQEYLQHHYKHTSPHTSRQISQPQTTTPPNNREESIPGLEEITDLEAVNNKILTKPDHQLIDPVKLFRRMKEEVRGQDQALRPLAAAISLHLAQPFPEKPGTLFAIGPTGVGKTCTAEALPRALRSIGVNGYSFLRLDMSEYQERYRVSQLIGSPQGYVGYGEGSQLLDALEKNPRTIVLFDEIEKAHPDVLTTLMNAMDAGRLSSAAPRSVGRELDCRRAVFFFTSNLDSAGILAELEDNRAYDDVEHLYTICQRRLRQAGIRSELIGRIGEFLVFCPLSEQTRAEILTLSVVKVAKRYGIHVRRVQPEVISSLLEKSHGQDFGVRPTERLVDRELGPVFARCSRHPLGSWKVIGPPYECSQQVSLC